MSILTDFDTQNKGLPTRFSIVNGKFALLGGKEKVDDNVSMLLSFVGWFRLFTQDYVINAYSFFQNTTSYLYRFKNILRLRVLSIGRRYVPFADFQSVDLSLNYRNRKETALYARYGYNLRDVTEKQTIRRVIL